MDFADRAHRRHQTGDKLARLVNQLLDLLGRNLRIARQVWPESLAEIAMLPVS